MSIEYCEECDTYIDTDGNPEGVYITTPAILYGESPEPSSTVYMCEDCNENKIMDQESLEAAEVDYYEEKRREL